MGLLLRTIQSHHFICITPKASSFLGRCLKIGIEEHIVSLDSFGLEQSPCFLGVPEQVGLNEFGILRHLDSWRPSREAVDLLPTFGSLSQNASHISARDAICSCDDGGQTLFMLREGRQGTVDAFCVDDLLVGGGHHEYFKHRLKYL